MEQPISHDELERAYAAICQGTGTPAVMVVDGKIYVRKSDGTVAVSEIDEEGRF